MLRGMLQARKFAMWERLGAMSVRIRGAGIIGMVWIVIVREAIRVMPIRPRELTANIVFLELTGVLPCHLQIPPPHLLPLMRVWWL